MLIPVLKISVSHCVLTKLNQTPTLILSEFNSNELGLLLKSLGFNLASVKIQQRRVTVFIQVKLVFIPGHQVLLFCQSLRLFSDTHSISSGIGALMHCLQQKTEENASVGLYRVKLWGKKSSRSLLSQMLSLFVFI